MAKTNESSLIDSSFFIEFSESIDDDVETIPVKEKTPLEIENEELTN